MAAVTITTKGRRAVIGDLVLYNFVVNVASNGDTLTIPGMKAIKTVSLTPNTNTAVGATIATNVITFVTGGALTALQVAVTGRD